MTFFFLLLADDDSDTNPHDLEGGGSDLEYGGANDGGSGSGGSGTSGGLNLGSHFSIGQHSFAQMQVCVFA